MSDGEGTLLLRASGLHKSYTLEQKPVTVLRGVDLTVSEGELLAVVGASGTGKSTLLNILGTLDTATSGTIHYQGRDLSQMDESALAAFRNRELGFVFQFNQLLPEFTALENAAMPLWVRRDKNALERAAHLLRRVGLEHRLNHRPAELSGGEQQRVAIARALVGEPRLLLADEPTGNLDSHSGETVFGLMEELAVSVGAAVMMVTHNEDLARRCRRMLHMVDGMLISG
ncbi:MAG: ABC transporter ATP-binding protein [Leptospirillia bacterium]